MRRSRNISSNTSADGRERDVVDLAIGGVPSAGIWF